MTETQPDLSFVIPAYNEAGGIGPVVTRLFEAFAQGGHRLELVVVDNGSTDDTGKVLGSLRERFPLLRVHRVEVNQGYGHGILEGIPLARGSWVGMIPADGQVDAEDVVRLYEAALSSGAGVVAKVRRRFRLDGFKRKVVSTAYNLLVLVLWPGIGTLDTNGSPKLLKREDLRAMRLTSRQWFLDPELMIKAHYLGLRVIELNVFARMRGTGLSNVRPSTCLEFLRELFRYRFTGVLREWRREHRELARAAAHQS
jgi:glycosyltransferase involved in cell wall biosynthesis